VGTLRIFNVDAQNYGTRILMIGHGGERRMLNVAEACAGLKSVMTFLMVAGTVAFLGSKPLWEKLVLTLSAIPIAIFCNTMRVAGQGLLDFYVSHDASVGFAHQFVGLIMLIPGFFLILLVGWIMEKIFIEEVDRTKLATAGAGRKKRVIVEVPRKKEGELEVGDGSGIGGGLVVQDPPAEAGSPVVPAPLPAPAKTIAAPPAALKSLPKERPIVAAPVTPAPSTLKPSNKPPVQRTGGVTPPPSGLKPSTLKPSASPNVAPAPSTLKPCTLKPSSLKAGVPGLRPPARSPSLAPPPRKPPMPPPQAGPGRVGPESV
jgi:exosortase/archaeosortase family protein